MEYMLGYREIIPDQTWPEKWKEIILNTGGSQSTLQDIKVPERAGGYCYKDSTKYFTRNRFIFWRIIHDVLELVEHSLDVNLINSRIRYKFTDTPILDGISVHETINSVIILIVTVSSIHKLSFPHPSKVEKQEEILLSHVDVTLQSIFSEILISNTRDPHIFRLIPNASSTNSPVAHAAASWLTIPQEEAVFVIAYNSGMIQLVRMDTVTGLVHSSELKHESIVPRFLSGIATAFRGRALEIEAAMSLVIHPIENDIYLFALCREGHLRMWSCNKTQCMVVVDVAINNRVPVQSYQNHGLKKTVNTQNELFLCTYLKLDIRSEFCIWKLIQECGGFKLARVCTLYGSEQHLVDFSFTLTRLWATWRTTDIDTIAVTHTKLPLPNSQYNYEWESAVLIHPPDKDYIISDSGTDPRQAYINYIFHPGQFSLLNISRALNIYQRSNFLSDVKLSLTLLKERVCMAVEAEIQNEVMDYELKDEEYLEIVNRCWSKFYSCVLQYHSNGSRPVGLLLLPNVCGIILLKKSSFSLLRPMEALEHMILCNEKSYVSRFKTTPIISQDLEICQDVITLMSALVILDEQLSDDFKITFEKKLYHLKGPDVIIRNLLSKFIFEGDEQFSDFDFQSKLCHKLESVKDISSAMSMLLEALTYDLGQPNKMELYKKYSKNSKILKDINYLFGSHLGISTLSKIVTQIATVRFSICRNLLILQQIILLRHEFFDSQSLYSIKSSLAPRTVVLTQAYFIVIWICSSSTSVIPSQALLEISIQRLAILKLPNGRSCIGQQRRSFSLLEFFIQYCIKYNVYNLVDHTNIDTSNIIFWHSGMLTLATFIAQLIWPISGNFFFPEWLLCSCQFLLLQEYVRLLSTWCEWNGASREFILGISLLEMGESQKACDHFLRASNGVLIDDYLCKLFSTHIVSKSGALIHYYLKVIELFEQHNASDCIIELAMTAMTIAEKDDPNLPTLHSIVFTQHLNLQHHIEAYNCLNTNPDAARRVDCLRQLVITLFNRKKLIDLIDFPYVDMYQDLEKIMESRARSVDLMENNYYDFLYSFYINNGNVRKAASIMYEQAIRLNQEPHSLSIILKHTNCLLACINALFLANNKYRWIVRPVIDHNALDECNLRKKRSAGGNEILQYRIKKKVEVLELKGIKEEYIIAHAKLKLTRLNPNIHLAAQTCPSEIVSIMCSAGLYINALDVCECFNLCKIPVLESIASQCVRLNNNDNITAWDWLNQNEIFDLNISTFNICNIAWQLLQFLTLTHEKNGETILHKGVARKLFHCGTFLPEWLFSSYAKRNPAEFLRLMIQMGRLEEAAFFSLDYIKAILGKGKEYFGLKTSLLALTPAVYLPFNTLEILLLELEDASKGDPAYLEVYEPLQNAFENYLQIAERVSVDMIKIRNLNRQK
ncbi:PREDICTED: nuclear pore complex protein Nup160 homolog [Ceratosolen solmsi marchali]|uniref:Nuclear pore complex protein Nup160 homolog n=1 Tax=Ceratosolen solmsi marchali TaxID=326594 RepID=A0AAJ6YQL1_9HYME|nr:PREDICTED: nuclear pore complex protein Nup160 homolog [Ceratosolen solmsi marchali]